MSPVPVDLSIVVVSYNTREMLLDCLRATCSQSVPDGFTYEVIVVDNQSTDASAEAVAERFPGVRLICLDTNVGFAAANNLGARVATGRLLLLLNPDTVVLDHAIEHAVSFHHRHPEAIVGGRTYFADGRLNPTSCHGWPTLWSVTCQGLGLSSIWRRSRLFNPEGLGAWRRDTVRTVPVVTGCFFLLPRTVWERLGGFDESFFMYGEETDLCMRAAVAGVPRFINPEARLVHHGGASEPVRADKMIRLFRSKATLYRKHWSPIAAAYGVSMLKLWALSRLVAHWLRDRLARRSIRSQEWAQIWRRRQEFSGSFPI